MNVDLNVPRATCDRPGDRGAISVVLMLLLMVTLAAGGLIVDGGRAMSARRHASNTAEAAARAAVSIATPVSGFDPVRARAAALAYARRAGVAPRDVTVAVQADVVTVTVVERRRAVFLAFGGIRTLTVRSTGSARLVFSG
ncbi:MAG: pilus assembly protein TadG-related protein [Actinomycetota bacterium]